MVVFSLTLVRHGETKFNRENIIQGQMDIPLSEIGHQQARLIALRLQDEKFTHVFASDLQRAAQTAQAILEANTACRCHLVRDAQLRERRFGDFEGKNFKDLAAAAQRQSVNVASFTPKGAEPISQVRQRARTFFQQLCREMLSFQGETEGVSTKRPLPGSLEDCPSPDTQLAASPPSPQHCNFPLQPPAPSPSPPPLIGCTKRARHTDPVFVLGDMDDENETLIGRSDSSSSSGCSSLPESAESGDADLPTPIEDTPPTAFSLDLDSEGHEPDPCEELAPGVGNNCVHQDDAEVFSPRFPVQERTDAGFSPSHEHTAKTSVAKSIDDETPPPVKHVDKLSVLSLSSDSAKAKLAAAFPKQPGSSPVMIPTAHPALRSRLGMGSSNTSGGAPTALSGNSLPLSMVSDAEIRNSVPGPSKVVHGCPNVSLSPLLEHRLSSLSSISSGRSSSLDEADLGPAVTAEVLVVSHSGFLKELVRHFVDALQCKLPGGKSLGLHCPNASISKFIVTAEEDEQPSVMCLLMHDKDHLLTMAVDEAKGIF